MNGLTSMTTTALSYWEALFPSNVSTIARGIWDLPSQFLTNNNLTDKKVSSIRNERDDDKFSAAIGQLCLNMIGQEEVGDQEINQFIENIFQEKSMEKKIIRAVNFLIASGVDPENIGVTFSSIGIEIPYKAYADRKLLDLFNQRSWLGSPGSHVSAIFRNGAKWVVHNWSSILGTWAIVEMVARLPLSAAKSECAVPTGTHTETCDVKSNTLYRSSDPHLQEIEFCQFEIECKKVLRYGEKVPMIELNKKILAREDTACLTHMENCDGVLISRPGNEQLCKNPTDAMYYAREELARRKQTGRERTEF